MEFYSIEKPQFVEGNVFKLTLPLTVRASDKATDKDSDKDTDKDTDKDSDKATDKVTHDILSFCITPKSMKEIQEYTGYKHQTHFTKNILNPLISTGRLALTIPDAPTHRNQKYIATNQQNP